MPTHVALFSKCLQACDVSELAQRAAALGVDGIDLTVRRGGHVAPESVERDLPLAVRAAQAAGLDVPIVSTDIVDAADPQAARVLDAAAACGVRCYRMGALYHGPDRRHWCDLGRFERVLDGLARLSERYRMTCAVQNHSLDDDLGVTFGPYFGGTLWDLAEVLRRLDSPWVGAQFDIGHATIESARSWTMGWTQLESRIVALQVKDFVWQRRGAAWEPAAVPIGHGMVDFPRFFALARPMLARVPLTFYVGHGADVTRAEDAGHVRAEVARLRLLAQG